MGEACVAMCFYAAMLSLPQYLWTWINFPVTLTFVSIAIVSWFSWRLYDVLSRNVLPVQYALSLSSDGVIRVVGDDNVANNRSSFHTQNHLLSHTLREAKEAGTAMKIHHASQLFAWGLCINVLRHKRKWFERDHNHLAWVLKGECCEADYRRLARAIILARKATHSRN